MHETEDLKGFERRLLVELQDIVRERGTALPSSTPARKGSLQPAGAPLRRWALLVAITVIVAGALVLGPAIVSPDGSGSSAFAVTVLDDGRIHVEVATDFDEGRRLQDELGKAGVKAEVITIESHPALVGIIEFPQHQLSPAGLERGDGEFWLDPSQFRGTVEVLIHSASDPGEEWTQAPSVFHPDEPLGGLPCALAGPMDSAVLERYARSAGINRFAWSVLEQDPEGASRTIEPQSVRPAGDVEHAERVAPDKIRVGVRPPAAIEKYGHAPAPSMNLNVHESPEPPCTAEMAARWPAR